MEILIIAAGVCLGEITANLVVAGVMAFLQKRQYQARLAAMEDWADTLKAEEVARAQAQE